MDTEKEKLFYIKNKISIMLNNGGFETIIKKEKRTNNICIFVITLLLFALLIIGWNLNIVKLVIPAVVFVVLPILAIFIWFNFFKLEDVTKMKILDTHEMKEEDVQLLIEVLSAYKNIEKNDAKLIIEEKSTDNIISAYKVHTIIKTLELEKNEAKNEKHTR